MSKLRVVESTGHGKACKGRKRTSTFQVIEPIPGGGHYLKRQFRFTVGDEASRKRALQKAREYCQ